jgi:hypothetical protein
MSALLLDYTIDKQHAVNQFLVKMVEKLKFELLSHPWHSPNLVPCDCHLIWTTPNH